MVTHKFSVKKFVYTFVITFIIWYGFTTSIQPAELITGAIVSLLIAYISVTSFNCCDPVLITPSHIGYFIKYFFVFIGALIKANFDVARRVLSPKLDINPGIVVFKTALKNDFAKMVLANSITLTPGTLTVDIIKDKFYIHWIDVTTEDPDKVFEEIAAPFEKILLKIYN